MNYLIYISVAADSFKEDELQQILSKSRENNASNSLTGMLLYGEGSFLQLLEGEEDVLNSIYEKIKSDKRHTNLSKLEEGITEARSFPDWTMGYKSASHSQILEAKEHANLRCVNLPDGIAEHPALAYLRTFVEINDL